MLTVDLDQLGLSPGQVCLDVGCGEADHTLATYLLEGVFALGLDLSAEDLATARGRITDMQPTLPAVRLVLRRETPLPCHLLMKRSMWSSPVKFWSTSLIISRTGGGLARVEARRAPVCQRSKAMA